MFSNFRDLLIALIFALGLAWGPVHAYEPGDEVLQWLQTLEVESHKSREWKEALNRLTERQLAYEERIRPRLRALCANDQLSHVKRAAVASLLANRFALADEDVKQVLGAVDDLQKLAQYDHADTVLRALGKAKLDASGATRLESSINHRSLYRAIVASFLDERDLGEMARKFGPLFWEFAVYPPKEFKDSPTRAKALGALYPLRSAPDPELDFALQELLDSKDIETRAEAFVAAQAVKNPTEELKMGVRSRFLRSKDLTEVLSFFNLASDWKMDDPATLDALAKYLHLRANAFGAPRLAIIEEWILKTLFKAPELSSGAIQSLHGYLDSHPSSNALELLIQNRPDDPKTGRYAINRLRSIDGDVPDFLARYLKERHRPELEALLIKQVAKGQGKSVRSVVTRHGPWSPGFEDELERLAKKGSAKAKASAKLLLGAIQPATSADVEDELFRLLVSKNADDRAKGALTLGKFRHDADVERALLKQLALEKDPFVANRIVKSIREVGILEYPAQEALLDLLFLRAQRFQKDTGAAAILAAREVFELLDEIDPAIYPRMEGYLRKGQGWSAALAIYRARRPADEALKKSILESYLAFEGKKEPVLMKAMEKLGLLKDLELEALGALDSPDPTVRARAAAVPFKGEGSSELLARAYVDEKSAEVRRKLVANLLEMTPDGVLSQNLMLDLMTKGTESERSKAFEALKRAGKLDEAVSAKLIAMATGGGPSGRDAAWLVRMLQEPEADELARLIRAFPRLGQYQREMLASSLRELERFSVFIVPEALPLLKSRDNELRLEAARLLLGGRLDHADAQAAIFQALKGEKEPSIRHYLWDSLRGRVLAENFPEIAPEIERLAFGDAGKYDQKQAVRVIAEWSLESPELMPALQKYVDDIYAPYWADADRAMKAALKENPHFADTTVASPSKCEPGRLRRALDVILFRRK